jgi:hypothetical protein
MSHTQGGRCLLPWSAIVEDDDREGSDGIYLGLVLGLYLGLHLGLHLGLPVSGHWRTRVWSQPKRKPEWLSEFESTRIMATPLKGQTLFLSSSTI